MSTQTLIDTPIKNHIQVHIQDHIQDLVKRRCTKCGLTLNVDKFSKKRTDEYYKFCDHCRTIAREYRIKHRCLHGKFLYDCTSCKLLKKQSKNI